MIDLVEYIADLDLDPTLHMARLLILINEFSSVEEEIGIVGLTKLAKLDFLLRYPVMLERALAKKNRSIRNLVIEPYERTSVESRMVRYRFGPWDHRYRHFLNLMSSRGFVRFSIEGRATVILLTEKGRTTAKQIGLDSSFLPYVERSRILKSNFNMTATNLMNFVYETFPELLSMRPNEAI